MAARLRRFVEAILPWYDPAVQEQQLAKSDELGTRLETALPAVDRIRRDYGLMADRLDFRERRKHPR